MPSHIYCISFDSQLGLTLFIFSGDHDLAFLARPEPGRSNLKSYGAAVGLSLEPSDVFISIFAKTPVNTPTFRGFAPILVAAHTN